jgi:tetratricopeptide (TPR) repeat protein
VTPESGPAHYRLHDLTYSYVNSLFQRERRPVRQIVDGVLSFVRQHLEDYNALDFDLMNILGVVHNGIQPASHEVLLEIMRLLVVDGEYFSARGHTPLSVSLLEEAIHSAEQVDTVLAHYLLSKLGVHQVAILGDSRAALASYRQALAFAPNDKRRAIILSLMGITAAKLDLSETVDFFDQAYKLACESRDDYTLSTILEQRGYYNATQENYAESRELFSQALRVIERLIAQQQGDWKDLGKRLFYALNNLAAAEQMLGHFDEALLLADRAQRVAEDHGNYLWMADVLVLKGENYHAMGNSEDARTHLLKGLQTYRSYGAIALAQQVEEFLATNGYDESTAEA